MGNSKETFDVHFNDCSNSSSEGFQCTYAHCLDYIETWNGTDHSYFGDYKGGTVSIVSNNDDGDSVYHTVVR